MTGVVAETRWAETERTWGLSLEGAPTVPFGYAGALEPQRATVTEWVRADRRNVTIRLEATNTRRNPNGVTFRGSWGAPQATTGNPAEYGHDGHGHINDLPAELVDAILAACDGITLPTSPHNNTAPPTTARRQD